MIKFFDTHKCEFCGTIFEWECTSFKNAKPVAYWLDDVMKNVKNVGLVLGRVHIMPLLHIKLLRQLILNVLLIK